VKLGAGIGITLPWKVRFTAGFCLPIDWGAGIGQGESASVILRGSEPDYAVGVGLDAFPVARCQFCRIEEKSESIDHVVSAGG
jgi:hypothetical protein